MTQREEYSITKYQNEDVQTLFDATAKASRLARMIRVTAKSDVDFYKLEYRDPNERAFYDELAETEEALERLSENLRRKYGECRFVQEGCPDAEPDGSLCNLS